MSKHEQNDCNGGHGCAGRDCACPCHYGRHAQQTRRKAKPRKALAQREVRH